MMNGKIWLISLLIVIVCFIMPGCANSNRQADVQSIQVPAECIKLWDIDLGADYSMAANGSYLTIWLSDDLGLELFVHRGSLANDDWTKHEKLIIDGITCYRSTSAANWDGTNESGEWISGTTYTQTLTYEQDGLVCTLAGSTDKKEVSLDGVSLKTARSLMDPSVKEYQQFRKTHETWTTGFQKGNITGGITITPPPLDQTAYQGWVNSDNCSFVKEGDQTYIRLNREDKEDSPNSAAIAFLSSHRLIELRAGVPYRQRNEIPREELDFITIELVNPSFDL